MRRLLWLCWLVLALIPGAALAHNPDTSYVRCSVADDHVDVKLTYDIFTLSKIVDLDADHDGRLTRAELKRGAPAIQRFLREHVGMEIDGQRVDLGEVLEPTWPDGTADSIAAPDWHAATSLITFPFHHGVSKPPHDVALTFTFFPQFGAQHTVLGVFEHRGKTLEVTFTEGEPDYLYDASYAPAASAAGVSTSSSETVPSALGRFLRLGVQHIFFGYDHICFLIALIVVGRVGELVKVITSFTIAHSITLILAALKIVTIPPRWVECGVALTIVYVAAENLWRRSPGHRWKVTFAFGLIHGFSFAYVLAGLGLPREAMVRCLLTFNVGVELGQLAIVLLLFPLVMLLEKSRYAARVKMAVSASVGLFGLGWFVERAFGFGFMPM